jgi:transposase-like protein
MATLPPPDTRRWVMRRKAQLVRAVCAEELTLSEACARYGISEEEFISWERLYSVHGAKGLRATRLHDYRSM